jgi:hypothetical protein
MPRLTSYAERLYGGPVPYLQVYKRQRDGHAGCTP